jgi:hypothetical protein
LSAYTAISPDADTPVELFLTENSTYPLLFPTNWPRVRELDEVTDKDPVIPNDPVINADPVYGKAVPPGAHEALNA